MLHTRVRFPRPRSRNVLIRALRFVWTAPTNALGHLAGLAVSGGRGARVGGRAAEGTTYRIRNGFGLDWVGAVTLGHAILYRPGIFLGPQGRRVLAHELAHTRQHDWLGPLYLPLHVLAQASSALLSMVLPGTPVHSRVHDRNPLEQTFIAFGVGACAKPPPRLSSELNIEAILDEYGV